MISAIARAQSRSSPKTSQVDVLPSRDVAQRSLMLRGVILIENARFSKLYSNL
ncbi:hypothetical protein SAMN04488557_2341 [Hyphomicrobium facile]|uniref:Uncharacterized protein n=1 Tax=Hyphomicrobium facile TaxID=51670 RepID=A0A1I7NIL0_9HYPH|nr:hypothetical protein SAMN04488557_2341 [Hyphomicrobium facile]